MESTTNKGNIYNHILELELKFDNKITVFMDTINMEMNQKIHGIKQEIKNRCHTMQSTLADFKIEIQNLINTNTQSDDESRKNVLSKIAKLSQDIELIDFQCELRNNMGKLTTSEKE